MYLLGWPFDHMKTYEVVAYIINSGRMFVGSGIDGVPIVDEKVLSAYFSSSEIPLLSVLEKGRSQAKHLSWFKIYNDFAELQHNLRRYLSAPPQIILNEQAFERKAVRIPCITEDSYKVFFARLVPRDVQPDEILGWQHSFPLSTIDNIDEELARMDVFF